MIDLTVPRMVLNLIDGRDEPAESRATFSKIAPANGDAFTCIARSGGADVDRAVQAARRAQPGWAATTVVQRGDLLRATAMLMREHRSQLAAIVSVETGKSNKDALGETDAAIEMGFFVAGEGRRFYGRTTTSAVLNRSAWTMRQPIGVAGLIIAANTPIANVAWKAFPALLCGNAAVLKAAEDTPVTAWAFGRLLTQAGVPPGVFNIVQGYGEEAGAPLVEHPAVGIVSFTGSCEVGRFIAERAGNRLAKVCLELGGKNPLVVCDDADLERAVQATVLSAFSNAGQRCAAGSRIIVFEQVYEAFKARLLKATTALKVGCGDEDDYGPVVNSAQLENMLAALERARASGARLLTGGHRLLDPSYRAGYYMAPTILENVSPADELSRTELFGPITCLYRVKDLDEAVALANDSPFGLTAAIHTASLHRAMAFANRVQSGVTSINGPTYGSEPHMPFGGLRQSGNGFREAGTEALDVYSEWKTVYVNHDPRAV